MFGELSTEVSFVRIEEEARRYWRRYGSLEAARDARRNGTPYIIHQQPIRVAGQSWDQQARLLVTTDLLARYHAMRGEAVHCQAGWSCHGLPIEFAVEKSLGPDLEGYDLAQFNDDCRQVAVEGVQRGEALAERLGVCWDLASAYATMTPQAITAVWGVLHQLWNAGRLKHEQRVVSFCPRCATPLSAVEAARQAVQVEGRSAWVRLPWEGEQGVYLLAQTPVPWTLLGVVALAAHPDAAYALVEVDGPDDAPPVRLLLAEIALRRSLPEGYRLVRKLSARSLRDTRYHPPFTFVPLGGAAGRVVLSPAVPLDRGTGLLPLTPAFDAPSLALAREHGLPVPRLLDDWGGLDDVVTPWRGLSPLDAEPLLVQDLEARGLLHRVQVEQRPRAVCPYCQTPLLPLVRPVWLVETAGEPWIVGRDRAWGAPLPVWSCERCGEQVCVAGLDDLAHRTGLDPDLITTHRPDVDRLTFSCTACGGAMRRVAALVDATFEEAVLPCATAPQPDPADLAVGLGPKDLGWLSDLTEAAALLRGSLAWERALTLPEGEAGPGGDLDRRTPADALRWAIYTGLTTEEAEREFLRPLRRLAAIPGGAGVQTRRAGTWSEEDHAFLDRWLTARLHQANKAIASALDALDPRRAAGALAALVHDLTAWYAPYRPEGLAETWEMLSRLSAPFVPHLAEALYRQAGGHVGQSVHLARWPTERPAPDDLAVLARMALVWRLAALGQTARARAGVSLERRLSRALIASLSEDSADAVGLMPFQRLLGAVLGVARVRLTPDALEEVGWQVSLARGRATEKRVSAQVVEEALAALAPEPAADLAAQLRRGLSASLEVAGRAITLLPDEVNLDVLARPGWAAAADAGLLVVLRVG